MMRTTITVPAQLVADARALRLNVSRLCQQTLANEVARLKAESWSEDNKAPIDVYNERIRRVGPALLGQRTW